ncbi:hypothetical protein PsYK624_048000 [Phanerochaete sordida]|uniref:Uncharacterized protein n=1 Tax=Phanerochaete sordida TaxID=48140 RepID=A0A9P3G407_9APHY|nr:hypothetical protein PsYK624_048000 [Phanerochaete sordida]
MTSLDLESPMTDHPVTNLAIHDVPSNPTPGYNELLARLKNLRFLVAQRRPTPEAPTGEVGNEGLPKIPTRLAPLFGSTYIYEGVEMMDAALQSVIELHEPTPRPVDWNNISWQDAVAEVQRNSAIRPEAKAQLSDPLVPYSWQSSRLCSCLDSPDEDVDDHIEAWFCGFVQGLEVQRAGNFDFKHLARFITGTDLFGATVTKMDSILGCTQESYKKELVATELLRYPCQTGPYVLLCHIKLEASFNRNTFMSFVTSETGGIKAEYTSHKFNLCQEVIDAIGDQVLQQAKADASAIFDDTLAAAEM